MPRWTDEQLLAIEKCGTNIIVSAGAGSGKTAVLSERVLHKLKNDVHINELLILTFTRAAAEEMKDRIRKKIKSDSSLKRELEGLDSAYITTFDSFALSVVKKYHYLLNIPKNIGITDESIVSIQKKKILDEVFEEFYEDGDTEFEYLVKRYCVKTDAFLRESISEIISKCENLIDKDTFIDSLDKFYYEDAHIDEMIDCYEEFIRSKKRYVESELDSARHYFETDYLVKLENAILPVLNTTSLDEFVCYKKIQLPPVPRGSSDEAKDKKASLKSAVDELLSYTEYGNQDDIKNDILSTKVIVKPIAKILKRYFAKMREYKENNGIYTFQDIAFLAIKIVRENRSARLELKNTFKEIMIDEYQDTNDIQETFIKYIANDNIYMVGDIKQSIYRFRGSNPIIFKSKYDNYSLNNGGFKIDLIKNFRSREEVLQNINRVFDLLMDNSLGGAEYYESHEMVFGNSTYDEQKLEDYDYNFQILEYENSKDTDYSDAEVEIFTIANDIKEKIESKMSVFDKETSTLRPIRYSDFVIILDRSKYFDTYKKVFEYLGIPLTVLKDGTLNASADIVIIKNIIDFIIRIKNNDYGVEFKFDFLSIGRSFLYEYSDQYLFDVITEGRFKETKLYEDFFNIPSYNSKTVSEIFTDILDITDFYNKIYKIGDYENINVRLSTIADVAENLETLGLTLEGFRDYLSEIIDNDYEIKYTEWNSNSDSVKILTIHKSKGLEYPICYFADLNHEFNTRELKNKFICDEKYGLIVPVDSEDSKDSVLKIVYKDEFMKSEIGEKIRLFYVALTRAREQMILVLPNKNADKLGKGENGTIDLMKRLQFKKLSEFIYACKPYMDKYFKDVNIENLNLSKNYLFNKPIEDHLDTEYTNDFEVRENHIENENVEESHFSKEVPNLVTKEESEVMNFGTSIHEMLEYIDFNNFEPNSIENEFIRHKISAFLNSDLLKDVSDATIYREYEFYYEKKDKRYHGIIDLMLEYDNRIDIIDYKLKNIDDVHYIDQLKGYRDYIRTISSKPINTYLYSILDESFREI